MIDQYTDRVASSPWVPQNIGRIPPLGVNTGAVEEVKEAEFNGYNFQIVAPDGPKPQKQDFQTSV